MTDLQTQNSAVPAMPDYLKGYSDQGIGIPEVDVKELRVPMLKMIQLQGTEYDEAKGNFGHIIDSISAEDFGDQIEIVVVDYKPNWIKWETGGRRMIGFSENGKTWEKGDLQGQLIADTEGDNAFKCKHYNYYVLIIENGVPRKLPYRISFSGMSAKAGDKIYQVLAQKAIAQKMPMFALGFTVRSIKTKNDSGSFTVFEVDLKPAYTSENVAKVAAEMYQMLKDENTKIIDDNEVKIDPTPATGTDADTNTATEPDQTPTKEVW
jgi:hypothetical protein